MKTQFETIEQYISTFPLEVQQILEKMRQIIRKEAPDAEESISYGMPTFKLYGRPLVYFAAFQHHIGFYPLPAVIDTFKSDLTRYKHARGSIQFPLDQPIPYELITKIVIFRVQEQINNNKK